MNTHSVLMKEASIAYPQGFPQMLEMSDTQFVQEIRLLAAAKLYEMGRLTAGKAAQLAGMSRLPFLARLVTFGVAAINIQDNEIDEEIVAARELTV